MSGWPIDIFGSKFTLEMHAKKHDSQFAKKTRQPVCKKKAQQHLKYAKLAQVPKNGRQPICSKKTTRQKKTRSRKRNPRQT
jgi:hypothetical protein